jgi:hypothetical protein
MEAACEEKTGRTQIEIQKMYWLMGRSSALPVCNRFLSQSGLMVFNYGVAPLKATEILYRDSRKEYSAISWMLPGTFEMTTCGNYQWRH